MSEDRKKILSMLKEGKISVDEAEELLEALDNKGDSGENIQPSAESKKPYKYLCVHVFEGKSNKQKVNVRVPLGLIRAGVKMGSIIPNDAKKKLDLKFGEKGINLDLDHIDPENIEELIEALGELSVEVDEENEKVRVFCE